MQQTKILTVLLVTKVPLDWSVNSYPKNGTLAQYTRVSIILVIMSQLQALTSHGCSNVKAKS